MKLRRPKHLGWIITGVVVAVLIALSTIPKPVPVEVAVVRFERLRQTIDAEGHVRFDAKFMVTMPANGTISGITLEAGDSVKAGQVITWYMPPELDPRQKSEAQARYETAAASEREAKQMLASLKPLVEQAKRRADRMQRLLESGAIPREEAESARDAYTRLQSEFGAAHTRVEMAKYTAQAALTATIVAPGQRVQILSPVSGIVLRRFEEFERPLSVGTPLIEIGTSKLAEVVIDVLSTDAVSIQQGMMVLIDGWGKEDTLLANVARIEPSAKLKVSALGVEEKRVDVVARLKDAPTNLGDGYKVDGHIVVMERERTLAIPLSCLAKESGRWFVYVVKNSKAVKHFVELGTRSSLTVEVTRGLREGDLVIMHPSETLSDGTAVEVAY